MLHVAFMSLGCLYVLAGAAATWAALHYQLPAMFLPVRQPEELTTDIWWWGTRLSPPVPALLGFAVALWLARPNSGRHGRTAHAAATLFGLAFSIGTAGEPILQPAESASAPLLLMLQAIVLAVPAAFTAISIILLAKRAP